MKRTAVNCMYMFKYLLRHCKAYVFFSFAIAALASVNSILSIYFIRIALNVATSKNSLSELLFFVALQASILILFSGLNSIYQGKISPISQQRFQCQMHYELFEKAASLELKKYDDPEFYNKYILALNNSDSRALSILDTFTTLLNSLFTISGLIAIISTLDKIIFLFVIFSVAISISLNMLLSKISYSLNLKLTPIHRGMSYIQRIYYLRNYAQELRLTNISASLKKMFLSFNNSGINQLHTTGVKKIVIYFLQSFVQIIYASGIMLYLAYQLFRGIIAAGDFAALLNSANQLSAALKNLFQAGPKLYEHSLYIENFREFISYEEASVRGNQHFTNFSSLDLKDITFSYDFRRKIVFDNFSLSVPRGSKIALVGANGAGKSTLVKIIAGLYSPQKGQVLINNLNVLNFDHVDIINNIGIIFQDYQIYALPLIENILLRPVSNKEQDEKAVVQALQRVGLYDKISKLPNGIYTNMTRELDPEGALFSGGELQRIVLARVLVQHYELLILDEPSSALDAISEAEIFKTIFEEYADRTVIIISHRLANIRNVDQIYYLQDGQIVEAGTHEELMQTNGMYARLYQAKL